MAFDLDDEELEFTRKFKNLGSFKVTITKEELDNLKQENKNLHEQITELLYKEVE